MAYIYEKNMTQAQLDVLIPEADLEAEWLLCNSNTLAADAAFPSLPATAASGEPVLHGSRKVTGNIMHYWLARRKLIEDLMSYEMYRRLTNIPDSNVEVKDEAQAMLDAAESEFGLPITFVDE